MKILIYGIGGYVDAVLLPALRKFNDLEIFVTSNNCINLFNFSKRHKLRSYNQQFDLNRFDAFFLCRAPLENLEFLKLIPCQKFIWIEKPLFPFIKKELIKFKNQIYKKHKNLHVGLNRSSNCSINLIKELIESNANLIEINYQIFKEEISPYTWRNSRVYHSPFWVDGINAYDLHRNCSRLLNKNVIEKNNFVSSKQLIEKDDGSLILNIVYEINKNKVITKIGNVLKSNLTINNKNFDIWDNKNAIKYCFHNIDDMFNRKFNFESSFLSHYYMRDLLSKNMQYIY